MAVNHLYIGISGKKYAGKDTLCNLIKDYAETKEFLSTRRGFADSLKEEVAELLLPYYLDHLHPTYITNHPDFYIKKQELLRTFNDPKEKEKYRLLLQWWGTEFRRQQFSDTYWLDALNTWVNRLWVDQMYNSQVLRETKFGRVISSVSSEKYNPILVIVPDVRFENEANFIKDCGGFLIRINRDSQIPKDSHPSETSLDHYPFDMTIQNNGSVDDLKLLLPAIMHKINQKCVQ